MVFRLPAYKKVWYRTSLRGSTLFAVDESGEVVSHAIYAPWGNPLTETYTDTNFSGIDNLNNFTGYTWDETLGVYYAQNRFYDPSNHRFTQEDPVKDGVNWYGYVRNSPTCNRDMLGLATYVEGTMRDKPNFTFDNGFKYDPNAVATNADLWEWFKWDVMAAGAAIMPNLQDAARMYHHYRKNTGTSVKIDLSRAYEEDSTYKQYYDIEIERMKNTVDTIYSETPKDTIEIIGTLQAIPNGASENWQKTIGAFYTYGHGVAKIKEKAKTVEMNVTFYMEDMYNFNPGQADIASGTPDSVNGRFAELGWAKEFKTYGSMSMTVKWDLGSSSYMQEIVCENERG